MAPRHRIPAARRRDPQRVYPHVGTRVEAFVKDADLGPIADLLGACRDDILRRWLEVASLQSFHADQPDRAVADHIPHLFDALVAFLRGVAPRAIDPSAPLDDPGVLAAARGHARDRFAQGLRAADVLTEFRLLRQEIGRALRERADGVGDVLGAELLVHDALDGATTLALAALDAHEEQRRHLAAEVVRLGAEKDQALADARFVAEAGELLAGSLDLATTLASFARLAVPRVADWCAVYLVDDDGTFRRVGATHADPAKQALLDRLIDTPLSLDASRPSRHTISTQETGATPRAVVDRHATSAEHAEILRILATDSASIVPLIARGQALGVLSFGRTGEGPVARELAEELARRAALAIDNSRLLREAQEAVRAREHLLAIVAHDLKTPLTSIKGNADLLHRRAVAGQVEPARVAERTAAIAAAAEAMAAQIGELLDAARLRAGRRLDLVRHPTDLVALAYRVAARVQMAAGGHVVEVRASEPELVGEWDAFRLERMLGNLLINAVKYSPAGGDVTLEVRREPRAGRSWAYLVVRDHGIGIPPADLPRVFEPYHRAANVGAIPGEGLGLDGSRHIVEQHGGTIEVESVEGEGATFTVRLPLGPPTLPDA